MLQLLAVLLPLLVSAAAGAARVESFSPEGTAKSVRQVAARFSEPMVPLGDPRSAARSVRDRLRRAKGASRWADARTWVYTFDDDLPAGVRCRFTLRAGRSARSPAPRSPGTRGFAFSTGGPAVLEIEPSDGRDRRGPALRAEARREPRRASRSSATPSCASRACRIRSACASSRASERDAVARERSTGRPTTRASLVLEARQRFAPGAQLALAWGAGIATAVRCRDRARSRPSTSRCARASARASPASARTRSADCVPLAPIRAVVLRRRSPWETALAQIVLRGGRRRGRWPAQRRDAGDGDPLVDAIEFRAPFPPRAKLARRDARRPARRRRPRARARRRRSRRDRSLPRRSRSSRRASASSRRRVAGPARRAAPRRGRRRAARAGRRRHARRALAVVAERPPRSSPGCTPLGRAHATTSRSSRRPASPRRRTTLALPPRAGRRRRRGGRHPARRARACTSSRSRAACSARRCSTRPAPMFVAAGALVTNLAVHFKWGGESSLVWVTTLDRARAGARARACASPTADGAVLARGDDRRERRRARRGPAERRTTSPTATTAATATTRAACSCWRERGGDLGIVHSSWSDGHRAVALRRRRPSGAPRSSPRAHDLRPHALPRRRDGAHEARAAPPGAGGLRAGAAGRAAEQAARSRTSAATTSWELPARLRTRTAAPSSDVDDPAAGEARQLRACSLLPRSGPAWDAASTGTLPRRGVPRAAGARRDPAAGRRRWSRARELPARLAVQYLAGGGASALPVTLRTQMRQRATSRSRLRRLRVRARRRQRRRARRSFGETSRLEREWRGRRRLARRAWREAGARRRAARSRRRS